VPESPFAPEASGEEESKVQSTRIAVHLFDSVIEAAVSQRPGEAGGRHCMSRRSFGCFLVDNCATAAMEACATAHFQGRRAVCPGTRRSADRAVRLCGLRNEIEGADAKELLEALRGDEVRPAPVESVDQRTLEASNRPKSGWMRTGAARLHTRQHPAA
jgi:hypothetical protein